MLRKISICEASIVLQRKSSSSISLLVKEELQGLVLLLMRVKQNTFPHILGSGVAPLCQKTPSTEKLQDRNGRGRKEKR